MCGCNWWLDDSIFFRVQGLTGYQLDKTTLSYAAIFGVNEDLHLKDVQYSWLSSIFYFGFIAWALPTNLLMQRYPVGKYLSINIILWGLFLMAQAAATNFASLAALRALSGAAEACADPGFMIITVMWYTRREQPIRIGLWYTSLGLGIAGGGLLGYGIGKIRGALPSWKYEFIIVGALCSGWGVVMFFVLPDSPVSAPLLSLRERKMAVERLRGNQTGIESKQFKLHQMVEALTDLKVFLFFMIALLQALVNGGITNFGTLIVKGFGYSTRKFPTGETTSAHVCSWNNTSPDTLRCFHLSDDLVVRFHQQQTARKQALSHGPSIPCPKHCCCSRHAVCSIAAQSWTSDMLLRKWLSNLSSRANGISAERFLQRIFCHVAFSHDE